jgi:hypothetical protein
MNENNNHYCYNTRGTVKQQRPINMEIDDNNFSSFINRSIISKEISWDQFEIIDEQQLFSDTEMIIACDGRSERRYNWVIWNISLKK